jgi:hypothetical protein
VRKHMIKLASVVLTLVLGVASGAVLADAGEVVFVFGAGTVYHASGSDEPVSVGLKLEQGDRVVTEVPNSSLKHSSLPPRKRMLERMPSRIVAFSNCSRVACDQSPVRLARKTKKPIGWKHRWPLSVFVALITSSICATVLAPARVC